MVMGWRGYRVMGRVLDNGEGIGQCGNGVERV